MKKSFPSASKTSKKGKKRDWPAINNRLVNQGDITFWIDAEVIEQWGRPERSGKPGRPRQYHDIAIIAFLTLKAIYCSGLRQTEGLLRSVFRLMRLPLAVPDFSTPSRRMPNLHVPPVRRARPGEPMHVVIDSTGLKVFGAGEWHQHKHGLRKRRRYRKLHLLIDANTCEILDVELTDSGVHDGTMLPIFLERNGDDIAALSADGAYDQHACYAALAQRHIRAVIPPRDDAIFRHDDPAWAMRNANLAEIERIGLEAWKHKNGYYRQSIAENGMYRYKALFGECLSARLFPSQRIEAKIRGSILNKMLGFQQHA